MKLFRQGDKPVRALDGVSLEVEQGKFLAIMGQSGSGKSTLLHLAAGLATADEGVVRVAGEDLAAMSDKKLTLFRRRQIGLIFQSFNLIPTLTAEENAALPLMLDGRGKEAKGRARELLTGLNLGARLDHRPDAMSGGEQQRVAIARALVGDPALILADEPTGNLDSVNGRQVCEVLRDLSAIHGKTVVMVTHEPAVAAYAGEVVVLRDGRIIDHFATSDHRTAAELARRYHEAVKV